MPIEVSLSAGSLGSDDVARVRSVLAAEADLAETSAQAAVCVCGGVEDDREPSIVVLADASRRAVSEALSAGAAGAVASADLETSLAPAVRAVAAGLVVVPSAARQSLRRPVLSTREKQILGMVVMGLTNAEIGRRLFVAESTVKHHLLTIYAELGVKSRKEAADILFDPTAGLGLGVLALTGLPEPQQDYVSPTVE